MQNEKLLPCPFCGGEAELVKRTLYLDHGYYVKCKECHCRSHYILVNHPVMTANGLDESTRYTDLQARQKTINNWNRRTTNERSD
jgi:Lar family restriction alleviation protein